ncbi:formyl transferase [Fictibacillus sp. 7GRE50]|uniref:formyltransferase family protein n=1 Tax=Fictibacillus sp. 7GRE50 TaxID=2745878 RepID=UPI0018CEDB34|nr:formyltransferase family protein [Fictibacillus sp. 7GRE50]MBH0164040.1 formyl transferase [Fictibacillus sp. 7GRE50]
MKLLLLGKQSENLFDFLIGLGNVVEQTENKLTLTEVNEYSPDFIISYGYRHIIKEEIVSCYKNKIINLHISYLPWNKGADPNLWSFLKNTTKGVTLHYIDTGLDTGDIITQKSIEFNSKETLKSSYETLCHEIELLFKETWTLIIENKILPIQQVGKGSYHRSKDKEYYLNLLTEGWNTPVNNLIGRALNKGE